MMDGRDWREVYDGHGTAAKVVCFIAGHDIEDRITYGGRWTRECQRCLKCWERFLRPYARGVSY